MRLRAPVIEMTSPSSATRDWVCWDNGSMQSVHGAGGADAPEAEG
jgi:hypothetical protein